MAAYMHRDAAVFNYAGQDMLLTAANNAKNYAQRVIDFEYSRLFAQLPSVHPTNGANLSGLQLFNTSTAVVAKSLEQAFLSTDSGASQMPVDFMSRDAYVNRVRRRLGENPTNSSSTSMPSTVTGIVQTGQVIYIVPGSQNGQSQTVYFDIIQWLPDFTTTALTGTTTSTSSGNLVDAGKTFITTNIRIGDVVTNTTTGASAVVTGVTSQTVLALSADIFTTGQTYSIAYVDATQTNFLLDYCFDYMLFRTIYELNFFLKEDSRVALSDTFMQALWENMKMWNITIIGNSVGDNDLN